MAARRFNPLEYSKKLQDAGVTREASEVIANEQCNFMNDLLDHHVCTKSELKETELNIRKDMKELELNLRKEMKELELRLTKLIMKSGLILGTSLATIIGICTAFLKMALTH